MKTIEVYDETLMNIYHVVINHIVRLRQTDEKATTLHMSDGNSLLFKRSLNEVLELIKNAK